MLFDMESDPNETRNLAKEPAYSEELLRLTRRMLDHRMTHQFSALTNTLIGETP